MHEATPQRRRSDPPASRRFALAGPGRAGRAVATALRRAGWHPVGVAGRSIHAPSTIAAAAAIGAPARVLEAVGHDAEVLLVATPDTVISQVSEAIAAALSPGALVVHLAGSRGLDAFAGAAERRPDVRFAALHPLVSIPGPDPEYLEGGWCAVAGDPDVYDLAAALRLHPFSVTAGDRAAYHAAAAIAANHLTALLGQVDRIAGSVGVPFAAYGPLVRGVVESCFAAGPRAALTGPVARGDTATVAAHLDALPADERDAYRVLATEALKLTGRDDPALARRLR